MKEGICRLGKTLFNPTNIWLFILFCMYSVFIILQSVLDPNGYVSSDSAHYLQLAQNFLNGDGMSTANYVTGMSTYFATWPIGYPALIAIVSFITGLSVFWASKIVNIICLGVVLILLKKLFQSRAVFASLVLFISTCTGIFVYSWSEVPFLLGMLWLVFGLVRYIETNKFTYAVHLFFASLFLFLMRYIGLIGAGIIGLLGFYYLYKKQWKQMLTCWITGSLSILLAVCYLIINYVKTGEFTGMERIPRAETAEQFFVMVRESLITEFNIFSNTSHDFPLATIIVLAIGLVLFIRPKQIKALFQLKKGQFVLPGMFLFVGMIYLIAIIYMRWTAYFDTLYYRLVGPATFMFGLFLISWIAQSERRDWARWQGVLTVVFLAVFISNIIMPSYQVLQDDKLPYKETVQQVKKTYEAIPKGSIVAFENIHARYLRPDIQFIKVHFQPYFSNAESLDEFVDRTSPNDAAGVFFQYKYIKGYKYDESFVRIMKQVEDSGRAFVELDEVVR
jgi:hypothetical protein